MEISVNMNFPGQQDLLKKSYLVRKQPHQSVYVFLFFSTFLLTDSWATLSMTGPLPLAPYTGQRPMGFGKRSELQNIVLSRKWNKPEGIIHTLNCTWTSRVSITWFVFQINKNKPDRIVMILHQNENIILWTSQWVLSPQRTIFLVSHGEEGTPSGVKGNGLRWPQNSHWMLQETQLQT